MKFSALPNDLPLTLGKRLTLREWETRAASNSRAAARKAIALTTFEMLDFSISEHAEAPKTEKSFRIPPIRVQFPSLPQLSAHLYSLPLPVLLATIQIVLNEDNHRPDNLTKCVINQVLKKQGRTLKRDSTTRRYLIGPIGE